MVGKEDQGSKEKCGKLQEKIFMETNITAMN